jgi:hypothetical protein
MGFGFSSSYSSYNSYNSAFSPDEFKRALGLHNSQFRQFETNDPKDLILYLLQTMHDELNYFGNKNQKMNLTIYYPYYKSQKKTVQKRINFKFNHI